MFRVLASKDASRDAQDIHKVGRHIGLVPQVKLPKQLDLTRKAARTHDAVPGLIMGNWLESKL